MTDTMNARDIIANYFSDQDLPLHNLMQYLDTDTLVAWFVDEDYVSNLYDDDECDFIMHYYDNHCCGR